MELICLLVTLPSEGGTERGGRQWVLKEGVPIEAREGAKRRGLIPLM